MRLFTKRSKVYPLKFVTPDKIFFNDICSICLDELTSFIVLPCGHCFHNKCISEWIYKNMTCPECRVEFVFSKK